MTESPGATIGGSTPGAGNVISGNSNDGIIIERSDDAVIRGNIIGLDAIGTAALGNGGYGIASDQDEGGTTTIGGTAAADRNVISGNLAGIVVNVGVAFLSQSGVTTIQGNYIGTDITGTLARGNSQYGVELDTSNNVIGGTIAGASNLISGNTIAGITVHASVGYTINGNTIQGNLNRDRFLGRDSDSKWRRSGPRQRRGRYIGRRRRGRGAQCDFRQFGKRRFHY